LRFLANVSPPHRYPQKENGATNRSAVSRYSDREFLAAPESISTILQQVER